MSSFGISDFIREAEKQQEFYNVQIARFDELLNGYRSKANDLQQRKDSALESITAFLLPKTDEAGFKSLAQLIQNPSVATYNEQMEKERAELAGRISRIEGSDEYQKREALGNPQSGVIATEIGEVQPMFDKAQEYVKKAEGMPRFKELITRGYGTSSYPHKGFFRFLNGEYLQDWKAADKITAEFGAGDFIDVLSQYRQYKQQAETFGDQLRELRAQQKHLNDIVLEHDHGADDLQNLEKHYRERAGRQIQNYLQNADPESVAKMFQGNPDLESSYKKLDGLDHQIEYMGQIAGKVTEDRGKMVEKSSAIAQEAQRYRSDPYRFRNKSFNQDQFSRKFNRDAARYDKMYNRYDRMGNTIYVFDNYNRGSWVSDFLWWDLMTDGRIDGNFIPQVQEYYNMHPGYMYERDVYNQPSDPDQIGGIQDNS